VGKSGMQVGTLLSVILWLFFFVPGHASEVKVGSTSLQINPPQGYCELDPAQPADAGLLQYSPTKNLLLSYSVDCTELADYRTGKRELIDHWARQVVLATLANTPPEADPQTYLNELCKEVRATGASVEAKTEAEIKAKIDKSVPSAKDIKLNFVGMLARDNSTCYTMTVTTLTAQNGVDRVIVFLTAFVMIKGKLVYHFLYAPYDDSETPIRMLSEHRNIIATIEASNP
jgi:hypothetical protein